ncbi:MAG: hypothetical protein ABFC84_04315 [Veillonellales bacterium]
MIINFDEQKFISEVKNMLKPLGLSKSQVKEVINHALDAVHKASTPVRE